VNGHFFNRKLLNYLLLSLDWFKGKCYRKPPYLMVKTMVSGEDFPKQTNAMVLKASSKIP
jgi:hypothetical protein